MFRGRAIQLLVPMALVCGGLLPNSGNAEQAHDDGAIKSRFEYLSQHGNVECSVQFENSIATMPSDAKLEGSCCAPMDEAVTDSSWMGSRSIPTLPRFRPILTTFRLPWLTS